MKEPEKKDVKKSRAAKETPLCKIPEESLHDGVCSKIR